MEGEDRSAVDAHLGHIRSLLKRNRNCSGSRHQRPPLHISARMHNGAGSAHRATPNFSWHFHSSSVDVAAASGHPAAEVAPPRGGSARPADEGNWAGAVGVPGSNPHASPPHAFASPSYSFSTIGTRTTPADTAILPRGVPVRGHSGGAVQAFAAAAGGGWDVTPAVGDPLGLPAQPPHTRVDPAHRQGVLARSAMRGVAPLVVTSSVLVPVVKREQMGWPGDYSSRRRGVVRRTEPPPAATAPLMDDGRDGNFDSDFAFYMSHCDFGDPATSGSDLNGPPQRLPVDHHVHHVPPAATAAAAAPLPLPVTALPMPPPRPQPEPHEGAQSLSFGSAHRSLSRADGPVSSSASDLDAGVVDPRPDGGGSTSAAASAARGRRRVSTGSRVLPPHASAVLKAWLLSPDHVHCPYPTEAEKTALAAQSTSLSRT